MKRYILGFSKEEFFSVSSIFVLLFIVMFINLQISMRRARDSQRKQDIRDIYNGLAQYQKDFGFFPLSQDGEIVACGGQKHDEKGMPTLTPCLYGWDKLADTQDSKYPAYLDRIPADPFHQKGYKYYFISDGSRFQIYASLEGHDEAEYNPKIEKRNLSCGEKLCNFGLGFSHTPVDRSLEEFENELNRNK